MVRLPDLDLRSEAAMTSLISLIPESTALKEMKSDLVSRAMRRARVVLPQPGGPQSSMEPMWSDSICLRSGLPGPRSFFLADEFVEGARAHALGERLKRGRSFRLDR